MSSISDALKKAQNSRVGDSPESVAPSSRAVLPRSEPPSASSPSRISPTVSVVAALAVGLVIVLVVTQYKTSAPTGGEGVDGVPLSSTGGQGVDVASRGVAVDQVPPSSAKTVDQASRSAPAVKPGAEKSDLSAPSPLGAEDRGEGGAPLEPKAAQESLPVLSGTFYSEQNPVAIINGFALKEGETVGVFRLVKILPRGVILKSGSGEVELRLK